MQTEQQLDIAKAEEILATCVCLNMRKATRAVTQIFDQFVRPCGVRTTQLPVLVTLTVAGVATITDLADHLVMDRTSLARLLKPLETDGLIAIAPGEDRRTREVSLTERGRETRAKAVPLWESAQRYVVAELGDKRWRNLMVDLQAAASVRQSAESK